PLVRFELFSELDLKLSQASRDGLRCEGARKALHVLEPASVEDARKGVALRGDGDETAARRELVEKLHSQPLHRRAECHPPGHRLGCLEEAFLDLYDAALRLVEDARGERGRVE